MADFIIFAVIALLAVGYQKVFRLMSEEKEAEGRRRESAPARPSRPPAPPRPSMKAAPRREILREPPANIGRGGGFARTLSEADFPRRSPLREIKKPALKNPLDLGSETPPLPRRAPAKTETFAEPRAAKSEARAEYYEAAFSGGDFSEAENSSGEFCGGCYDSHNYLSAYADAITDRESLSKAVVLSEILSKPLALREDSFGKFS